MRNTISLLLIAVTMAAGGVHAQPPASGSAAAEDRGRSEVNLECRAPDGKECPPSRAKDSTVTTTDALLLGGTVNALTANRQASRSIRSAPVRAA